MSPNKLRITYRVPAGEDEIFGPNIVFSRENTFQVKCDGASSGRIIDASVVERGKAIDITIELDGEVSVEGIGITTGRLSVPTRPSWWRRLGG